jgi:hypothetical protein
MWKKCGVRFWSMYFYVLVAKTKERVEDLVNTLRSSKELSQNSRAQCKTRQESEKVVRHLNAAVFSSG